VSDSEKNILFGGIVSLFVGIAVWWVASTHQQHVEEEQATLPLKAEANRNAETLSMDIDTTNPSTTTYRAERATFKRTAIIKPDNKARAMIEADQIVFDNGDRARVRPIWSKRISSIKFPVRDHGTIRVYIIEKRRRRPVFYEGELTIDYIDLQGTRRTFRFEKLPVLVVGDPSQIPKGDHVAK